MRPRLQPAGHGYNQPRLQPATAAAGHACDRRRGHDLRARLAALVGVHQLLHLGLGGEALTVRRCGGAAVRRCGGAAVRRCSARWLEGAQADPRACATWGSRARPKPDTRALRLARAGLAVRSALCESWSGQGRRAAGSTVSSLRRCHLLLEGRRVVEELCHLRVVSHRLLQHRVPLEARRQARHVHALAAWMAKGGDIGRQ